MTKKSGVHHPDYVFLACIGFLLLSGIIALTSASGIVAYTKFDGDSLLYVKRQLLFGVFPGLVLFSVGFFLPYRLWRSIAFPFFLLSLLLLALVLIPGVGESYGRARSWFSFGGFSFQPSEMAKIALLFYLAAKFEQLGNDIRSFSSGFLPFVLALGVVAGLIMLQPDIGTMGAVALIALTVYFVAGASFRHLGILFVLGGGALGMLIALAPYRLARLATFFSPSLDPSGSGYQLTQSLVAIGSGGLFGVGLGASRQKFQYLPEVVGDSIFAVIGEEVGFVALVVLILLFFGLMVRGFRIARWAPDPFARFFTVGVIAWILLQALLNMGSMVGLLPLTGLPLPFMSYGGTALAMILFACGIVANMSKYTHS